MLFKTKANSKNHYELVNKQNSVKPGYDLAGEEYYFDIYIRHTQEICIVCRIDNNYISGLSFSTVSDLERTQAIIDGMIDSFGATVSNEYSVLGREKYYGLLSRYKRSDKEAHGYYYEMKNLIGIIDEECYLKLSRDNEVRELYLSLKDCASALYGARMDVER